MSMVRKKVLYLFDVDGTLTKPRQVIEEEMTRFLLEDLKPRVAVALVSGSDYSKIVEQMGGEQVTNQFDYVFCENGLMHFHNGELKSKQSILNHMGEQKLQKLINFALRYLSDIELPVKRGNFVEFRTGMINLCPVGRSCNQAERDQFSAYDSKNKIREKFVTALRNEFPDYGLTFAIGGQISIDVFPTGWDKTYCLNHIADANYDEIHFFGDKTEKGGNDYEIFIDQRTIGHKVTSPQNTKEVVMKCLNI
ncbi:unnamed protein product [Diatraea saccharalis]|uniref:Phosphomannomutase n=1 Tax=Diatraea saccharalis TaxID=40085 RepID=A0A9N9QZ11_9NEOP|nr:unnamed protein product [Diatraea saccharalis]